MHRWWLIVTLVVVAGCWNSRAAPTAAGLVTRGWQVPATWPVTPSLRGIHGTSLDDLYAVGDRGVVLHSVDRGVSWTRLDSRSDLFFRGVWSGALGVVAIGELWNETGSGRAVIVRYVDGIPRVDVALEDVTVTFTAVWGIGSEIYVSGYRASPAGRRGIIGRSLDGGATWTATQLETAELVAIGGTDAAVHALTRDGALLTSRNHGASYTLMARLPDGEYESLDVAPGRLLAATAHKNIVRSLDQGATWSEVRPGSAGHVWSVGDHVLAFSNGSLDRSLDGGTTWTSRSTGDIVTAVWGDRDGLVAVGQGGLVSTSPDGVVWTRRDRGVVGSLYDVWGTSDDDVYVVGEDGGRGGVVVHATRGGRDFAFARHDWAPLHGVWSSGDVVVVVGERGTILRSRDHGASWQPTQAPSAVALNAVGGCGPDAIYAVGEAGAMIGQEGAILYSRDRGTTWASVVLGEPVARLTDVACVGEVVYAAGPIDVIRLTAGHASRFGARPTSTEREGVWTEQVGAVGGRDHEVWWLTDRGLRRTTDGGASWTPTRIVEPHYSAWGSGETLWLGGWSGRVITLDRSGHQHRKWTGVDGSLGAIWGTSDGELWAVGGQGTLVRWAVR